MRCIELSLIDGSKEYATELTMAPQALVLLGQVLADNVGLSPDELIWIGSPSWVVAGAITESLLASARRKLDERRVADIRRLVSLAHSYSRPIPDSAISGVPAASLSALDGHGRAFDLEMALPPQTRWRGLLFGGSEGTFAGVSPKRERKAREALRDCARAYVVDPWSTTLKGRFRGRDFEIRKDQIALVSIGDAPDEAAQPAAAASLPAGRA